MDGKLEDSTIETQLRGNMRFQDSSDQEKQLRALVTDPPEDIVSKCHKLQQESEHLHTLLAEWEAHSLGLQKGITKLWKELQRRMHCGQYFKSKRNCREAERRHPRDFRRLSVTMRRHHGNCRPELHNLRQWDDRPESMSAPGLHTLPFHNALYHTGPSAKGWSNGQIKANQAWNNPDRC